MFPARCKLRKVLAGQKGQFSGGPRGFNKHQTRSDCGTAGYIRLVASM